MVSLPEGESAGKKTCAKGITDGKAKRELDDKKAMKKYTNIPRKRSGVLIRSSPRIMKEKGGKGCFRGGAVFCRFRRGKKERRTRTAGRTP